MNNMKGAVMKEVGSLHYSTAPYDFAGYYTVENRDCL